MCSQTIGMRTSNTFMLFSALLLAMLGTVSLASEPVHAAATKTMTIDPCDQEYLDSTVFLFETDVLEINFLSCESVDFFRELNGTQEEFLTTSVRGTITIHGDGTVTVMNTNGTPTEICDDCIWANESGQELFIRFTGEPQRYNFLSVEKVNQNVTQISGSTLLETPQFTYPTTVSETGLLSSDADIDQCLEWFEDEPQRNSHPFVTHQFTTNVAGNFTVRTISTTPTSSFTNYLDTLPTGFSGATPMPSNPLDEANFLIYRDFDPSNPSEGLVACGVNRVNTGNYLDTGEILEREYFQVETFLEAGTYTVVSALYAPVSLATWNDSNGERWWTPVEGQSVNTQIWGPAQLPTSQTPALSATGGQNIAPLAAMLFTAGLALLWLRRRFMTN